MSSVQENAKAASFQPDPSERQHDVLASALREALPYTTSHRLNLLMKRLSELGVRSENQMAAVKECDLEGTVSSYEAKKLLVFFTERATKMDVVISRGIRSLEGTDGQRKTSLCNRFTGEDDKVFSALQELPHALHRDHAKRRDIHEGTLLDIDENMSRMGEDHSVRIEEIDRTEEMAARAHKKFLEEMEEEERRREEMRRKKLLEFEEMERESINRQPTVNGFIQGLAQFAGHAASCIRSVKQALDQGAPPGGRREQQQPQDDGSRMRDK